MCLLLHSLLQSLLERAKVTKDKLEAREQELKKLKRRRLKRRMSGKAIFLVSLVVLAVVLEQVAMVDAIPNGSPPISKERSLGHLHTWFLGPSAYCV